MRGEFILFWITYPWFEVNEDRSRYVMLVIGLVEKHVFAVATLGRPVLEDAFFVDPVLCAQPLPED
jgi:hypothetical protein